MKIMDYSKFNQPLDTKNQQQIHFQMLLILKSFSAMLAGDESLDSVGEMSLALVETPAFELVTQHLERHPACVQLIRDRYVPPNYDLDKLLSCPENSLGDIYATSMRKTQLDPNLHAGMTAESDAHYVELRLTQNHDIWHIVTVKTDVVETTRWVVSTKIYIFHE